MRNVDRSFYRAVSGDRNVRRFVRDAVSVLHRNVRPERVLAVNKWNDRRCLLAVLP